MLRSQPWAKRLVRRAVQMGDEPTMFELRFGFELHLAGLSPRYESPGLDSSTVDFGLYGTPAWNIELVSPQVSDAISDATVLETLPSGLRTETLVLGFGHGNPKQTIAHDLFRLQRSILNKVHDGKKPTKFPVPCEATANVIVVDVRSFLGGDGDIDRDDLRQIMFGPQRVPVECVHTRSQTGEPIRGLFETSNMSAAFRTVRERIHLVIAVHEQDFVDDEIRQTLVTFSNPHLPDRSATLPFRWTTTAPLRDQNPLWNQG